MEQPLEMPWGKVVPTGVIVQEASRQVGKKSEHWVTLSALRTLVVTTMLGRAGLQYGAKPVSLPDGTDHETVEAEVTTLVHSILQRYSKHFHAKEATLIGSPAIMAGIGVVAHRTIHTLPSNSDKPALTVEELFELLDPVRWDREERWDGVATRKTPSGVTTVAGPKEVGYAAAAALEFSDKKSGAQIRNLPIPEEPQSAIPVVEEPQSAIPVAGFQQPAMQPTFG
jgi:DNA sulfur modification protein DndB